MSDFTQGMAAYDKQKNHQSVFQTNQVGGKAQRIDLTSLDVEKVLDVVMSFSSEKNYYELLNIILNNMMEMTNASNAINSSCKPKINVMSKFFAPNDFSTPIL